MTQGIEHEKGDHLPPTRKSSTGISVQPAHQETFLSICHLLYPWNVLGLMKNGGKDDGLADGRSRLAVRVHLLAVSGLGLEVHGEGLTVDEPVAGNDTDVRALCEDVQQHILCLFCQFGPCTNG